MSLINIDIFFLNGRLSLIAKASQRLDVHTQRKSKEQEPKTETKKEIKQQH